MSVAVFIDGIVQQSQWFLKLGNEDLRPFLFLLKSMTIIFSSLWLVDYFFNIIFDFPVKCWLRTGKVFW